MALNKACDLSEADWQPQTYVKLIVPGTRYVLSSLNLDQCYFCVTSMNSGPRAVIELN